VFVRRVASARPEYVKNAKKKKCSGTGLFHFYVGHRLWHAPENSPASNVIEGESGPCVFFSQKFGTIIPEQ
jgi:hypothetical protein